MLALDLDRAEVFFQIARPGVPLPSRFVLEIMLHKGRTAVTTLPLEARQHSKRWLAQRGLSFDADGDL